MKKIVLIALLLLSAVTYSQNNTLRVVGNLNAVPSQLSLVELQSVFMGTKPKWNTTDKVVLAMMNLNTAAGKATCDKIYKMTADAVKKYWLALSFKGTIKAPVFFNTAEEVVSFVSKNRGAIGIIDVPKTLTGTKAVLINNKPTF
jgi:hypothetical protein